MNLRIECKTQHENIKFTVYTNTVNMIMLYTHRPYTILQLRLCVFARSPNVHWAWAAVL